ncbi:dynein heavy chain, N-terminal region 1-domain-containing protein [Yarrowia lipolytica]|nr:dynein heavy chain, N-terminal region 1-domain-containing protein [Yarrowia lipolytica]
MPVSQDQVTAHVKSIITTLLSAQPENLTLDFTCELFTPGDVAAQVLFVSNGNAEDNYIISQRPESGSSLVLIKPYGVLESLSHLQVMNIASSSLDSSRDKGLQFVRKKLAELEMSFHHLENDVTIPDVDLEIHPAIEDAIEKNQGADDLTELDAKTLNELQTCVNSWIKQIQTVTKLDRDPAEPGSSTASEINFWLTMEDKLDYISKQLDAKPVTLTLDVLKNAKRFHATVSFLSDTGLKEAQDMVSKYNVLLRDFPLDELMSADSLDTLTTSLVSVFNHVNKKFRLSTYPVWRCLALVGCVSGDFDKQIKVILSRLELSLMQLPSTEFNQVIDSVNNVFNVWNDLNKEFTNTARDVSRRRQGTSLGEKFIPIRVKVRHSETQNRIAYIANFRQAHEDLVATLGKVSEAAGVDIDEITTGYELVRNVPDVLDVSHEALAHWNRLEEGYNNATVSVERSIISILRDRLALAKNSAEMFRVFAKFNSLFIRPTIRGAIHEYQSRLIENVKHDLVELQQKFKRKYGNSETFEMAKLRDLPPIAGAIIWMKQLERQLDLYMSRVESVLGAGWQHYADGKVLHEESVVFRKSLDARVVYEAWIRGVKSRGSGGPVFKISRESRESQELVLSVSFSPTSITLFKEVRNLLNMKFQVPHTLVSMANDAKTIYPFAVSLMDSVQVMDRTLSVIDSRDLPRELLFGFENAIYNLVSRGMSTTWDDLLHMDTSGKNQHQRFVYKLSDAVHTLLTKSERLSEVWGHVISNHLMELESCDFSRDEFAKVLADLQAAYDSLEHDGFANMQAFARTLNLKVKTILEKRLGQEYAQFFDKTQFGNHVMVLKNNVICVEPPLQDSRVKFVGHVMQLKNTVAGLTQIEGVSRVFEGGIQTYESLMDDSRTLTSREKSTRDHASSRDLYLTFDHAYSAASAYIAKWTHFQSLWTLSPDHVISILGDDLSKWLAVLQEIRKSRASTFDSNSSHVSFGNGEVFKLDIGHVTSRISSKYDAWQSSILQKFAEKLSTQSRDLCGEMDRIRADLEPSGIDSSVEKTLEFVTCVVDTRNEKLPNWESKVGLLKTCQNTLIRNRFVFPQDWLYIDHVESLFETLQELIETKEGIIEGQRDALKSKITVELGRFGDRVESHVSTWAETKEQGLGQTGDKSREQSRELLHKHLTTTNKLLHDFTVLESASRALDIPCDVTSASEILNVVSGEIQDFITVFATLESVWKGVDELREMSWHVISVRKLRSIIDSLVISSKSMPSRVRQYAAFDHVQQELKSLLKTLPLISQLKSDAFKTRHWEQLAKMVKKPTLRLSNHLTLGNVWDCGLELYESQIKALIAQAQGELVLEEFLAGVRSTWTNLTLNLVNFKNKVRLIKNWDEIFLTCSDHMTGLLGMHNSPYFKVFEEECHGWENKLSRVQTLFEIWINVQKQWVYLEGLFGAENGSEVRAILPLETSRFGNINAEFMLLWKQVYKSPLISDVINIAQIDETLPRLNDALAKIQKSLGEFLEQQRQLFPRFYFVGDEDLLEMIGSPNTLNSHVKKMFSGVSSVDQDEDGRILGVASRESEIVPLLAPITTLGVKIETTLKHLESGIRSSLKNLLGQALEDFSTEFSAKQFMIWIQKYPGQIALLALQIWWTAEGEKGEYATARDACVNMLGQLAEHVSRELTALDRLKCENLITELIHLRDSCDEPTNSDGAARDASSYDWLKLMRFYRDGAGEVTVRQDLATFSYSWEYLGVPPRLVSTPLVDACYRCMTSALASKQGGSPFGPAGTGKTESIKSLGQNLGVFVLVFNCDESFNFQAISRILAGICQAGVWACFDEFNRLDESSLSAVTSLIEVIQGGLARDVDASRERVSLGSRDITLLPSTGIFITLNPAYLGRSTLPDNLKKLFRPFSMAKPDKEEICQVVLYSQGFSEARSLAQKVVPFFERCEKDLSEQKHYDWGLRAVKSVLRGARTREQPHDESTSEELAMQTASITRSLQTTICPMLVEEDSAKFGTILEDIFGAVEPVEISQELEFRLVESAAQHGYTPSPPWVTKCAQLNDLISNHHGVMLVGAAGSGKSAIVQTLGTSLGAKISVIDPKVMSKEELYGSLDATTRDWKDGVFTSILRNVINNVTGESSRSPHWIVFDGDVDPDWVENLNSVLDDNKVFTLASGERLQLPDHVNILFEVDSLQYATPATVSRCGMVYVGDNVVDKRDLIDHHLKKFSAKKLDVDVALELLESGPRLPVWTSSAEAAAGVASLDGAVDGALTSGRASSTPPPDTPETIVSAAMVTLTACALTHIDDILSQARSFTHVMEFTPIRAISTLFAFVEDACKSLLVAQVTLSHDQVNAYLTRRLVLALIWSFSGDSRDMERHNFSKFLFEKVFMGVSALSSVNYAELCVEETLNHEVSFEGAWTRYKVADTALPTHAITNPNTIIPTTDTVKHEHIIYGLLSSHKPVLLCGPPGSGKTMTLFGALRRSDRFDMVALNFSKTSDPGLVLKTLFQRCQVTTGSHASGSRGPVLSPRIPGKWIILFCDEINLPSRDQYGTQHVISFLRQLIEKNGFWYNNEWTTLERIQVVGACNPPEDVGRNVLSQRILRHVTLVNVGYPGNESLNQIYGSFNKSLLKCIPSLAGYGDQLTKTMISYYQSFSDVFTSASHVHYIYSPRELTRWSRGIYEAISQLETLSVDGLVQVVGHEGMRLFLDRLVTDEEKEKGLAMLVNVLSREFTLGSAHVSSLLTDLLFSNWTTKHYLPISKELITSYVTSRVPTFCEEELDTPFVLSDDVIEHILRIDRVLRQPQGHMILIGEAGSGRTTMTRFVAWLAGVKCFQLRVSRDYQVTDFDSDLRALLLNCVSQKMCFLLNEADLTPLYLERMNTLLANAEIPGLFQDDDWSMLMSHVRQESSKAGILLDSDQEVYEWFTQKVVENLHVILVTQKGIDLTSSPALLNRCVLNWMGNWSGQGVTQMAEKMCQQLDVSAETLQVFGSLHVTPDLSLASIKLFIKVYLEKKAQLQQEQRHLNSGVDKLKETVLAVREMELTLEKSKIELNAKTEAAQRTLQQMITNQNDAEKKKQASLQIQESLESQKEEIARRQEVVAKDLALAEPAVISAKKSVSNIKKQHLTELRSMLNPPETIKLCMESVCVILGYKTSSWRDVQAIIRRDDFISSIVNFDSSEMDSRLRLTMEREYLSRENYTYEAANRASKACGPLLQWVVAQIQYCEILERISPLKEEVEMLRHQSQQTQAQATAICDMIDELEGKIEGYRTEYAGLIGESERLKDELATVGERITRSRDLVTSLSDEKRRWAKSIVDFDSKLANLAGNCLICGFALARWGGLSQKQRGELLRAVLTQLDSRHVKYNLPTQDEILAFLDTPDLSHLPSRDPLSVENAVIVESASTYPLIIDPTDRIRQFLIKQYKPVITSFLDSAFVKHLETALRFGQVILITDAEYLDPVINPVLNKEYHKTGGRTLIQLGKSLIDFNSNFRLFLLSRDSSPSSFSAHVTSRTTRVNFTVTDASLERQLSSHVLAKKRPDVDEKRKSLIKLQNECQANLRALEADLLASLAESEDILGNNAVMVKLEKLKQEARHLTQQGEEAQEALGHVDLITKQFDPLAQAATRLFAVMQKLSSVNVVYKFSLEFFLQVFLEVISTDCDDVQILTKQLFIAVYKQVSSALFYKDRYIFCLLIIEAFTGERDHVTATEDLTQIINSLGSHHFGDLQSESLDETVTEGNHLVMMVSRGGADATYLVRDIAQKIGMTTQTVSMGSLESQNMADKMIQAASQSGEWVLVQNAHLERQWLTKLEKWLRLNVGRHHTSFRLFVSFDEASCDVVPSTLLLMSRLVACETSSGVKAGLEMAWRDTQDAKPVELTRLNFLASWLHVCIVDLARFVPLGFAKDYGFHEGDLAASLRAIEGWVRHVSGQRDNIAPHSIPWHAVVSVLSDIYSAKIDIAADLARLQEMVQQVMQVDYFDNESRALGPCKLTTGSRVADFQTWTNELPVQDATWLGLHESADEELRIVEAGRVVGFVEELRD